jgi:hypothetical protein
LFFLYIIFLGKIGIRCWIWTNKGLKVEFYVEFDIDVIIYICVYIYVYIYTCMIMYIYIYIWRLKESDRFLVAGFWLFPLGWTLWVRLDVPDQPLRFGITYLQHVSIYIAKIDIFLQWIVIYIYMYMQ